MRHTLRLRDGIHFATRFDGAASRPDDSIPSIRSSAVPPPVTDLKEIADDGTSVYSLAELLPQGRFFGCEDLTFSSIAEDPEHCGMGELVLCRTGVGDPNQIIAAALAGGAAGILTEQLLPCPLPQCIVGDIDRALASLASTTNHRPDTRLLTIGVLGASGKTSTCLLISTLTTASGLRTAYQCDLGSHEGVIASTPAVPTPKGAGLVEWLAEAADCCSKLAVIEVDETDARHGHYDEIEFDLLVVTQRDSKEGDFGPSALQSVTDRLAGSGVVVINATDATSKRWLQQHDVSFVTYGISHGCDYAALPINHDGGVSTLMLAAGQTNAVMETNLCGLAMARNIAAASAVGGLLGYSPDVIAQRLERLR
ncbi:MAG: Mur ligase family protein, partial [Planctomycetota bacterium]